MTGEEKLAHLERQEWNAWANLDENPHATYQYTHIEALIIIERCQRIRANLKATMDMNPPVILEARTC